MSVDRDELSRWLDAYLRPQDFADYAPNGLQVEGSATIERVVCGVSANQALIDQAIERDADALLVHHGFFWKNEPRTLIGHRRARVAKLLGADISLFGYHLPLDAHGEVGNNVGILRLLGYEPEDRFGGEPPLGWRSVAHERLLDDVVARAREQLGSQGYAFLHGPQRVRRVGVVTGGGAGFFEEALEAGCDLFLTGEPSEQSQGLARELRGNFLALGHHATERIGVQLLGAQLAERFGIDVQFVDVDNPV